MGVASVHAVQTLFLLLLILVVVFAALARRLQIPYPIVLVIAGLLISLFPQIPRIPLNPDLIFLIFLPPLLYASAWAMSGRELRANLLSIMFLAFGLVGFTVWGVAELSTRLGLLKDWRAGIVLGAVVSTTDAVAATSIARNLGLPRRIVDILEGESLFNDATGLLALEFGLLLLVQGEAPSASSAILRLLYLVCGGLGIGLLIGLVVTWIERFLDDGPIEIVLSLIIPYAAYLAGEAIHASGILAVVACGLYLSPKSALFFSPTVRLQINMVWDVLTFILNGIVFVLIGFQLPLILAGIRGLGMTTLIEYGAVFSFVLIGLRLAWVFPASWVSDWIYRRLLRHPEGAPDARSVFIIGWTGMRGVIALAAAISLPETLAGGAPFEARNLILFLTFSVILVTLVLQGLTLPPIIRALGLAGTSEHDPEARDARRIMFEEAIDFLKAGRARDGASLEHLYDDLIHRYRHRLAAVGGPAEEHEIDPESYRRLREISANALQAERSAMIRLRNQGRISDDALRELQHELDLAESRYASIKLD